MHQVMKIFMKKGEEDAQVKTEAQVQATAKLAKRLKKKQHQKMMHQQQLRMKQ